MGPGALDPATDLYTLALCTFDNTYAPMDVRQPLHGAVDSVRISKARRTFALP